MIASSCAVFAGILSLPSSLHLQGSRSPPDPAAGRAATRGTRRSLSLDHDVSMVKNVEQSLLATCVGSLAELGRKNT